MDSEVGNIPTCLDLLIPLILLSSLHSQRNESRLRFQQGLTDDCEVKQHSETCLHPSPSSEALWPPGSQLELKYSDTPETEGS